MRRWPGSLIEPKPTKAGSQGSIPKVQLSDCMDVVGIYLVCEAGRK